MTGCATSGEIQRPIILTNSQFTCSAAPVVPEKDFTDAALAVYITRLDTAGEDCRGQLAEIKNVLEVQGAIITDVLVTEQKPKRGLWPF